MGRDRKKDADDEAATINVIQSKASPHPPTVHLQNVHLLFPLVHTYYNLSLIHI